MNKKQKAIGILTPLTLAGLFLTWNNVIPFKSGKNRRNSYPFEEHSKIYRMQEEGDVRFYLVGEEHTGTPYVLIPPANPIYAANFYKRVIPLLALTSKVFIYDPLGCGDSNKPGYTYAAPVQAHILESFLRDVVCEKANIVGFGDAAISILTTGAENSDFIEGIYLIQPPVTQKQGSYKKWRQTLYQLPLIGTTLYIRDNHYKDIVEELLHPLKNPNPAFLSEEDLNDFYSNAFRGDQKLRHIYATRQEGYHMLPIHMLLCHQSKPVHVLFSKGYREVNEGLRLYGREDGKYMTCLETDDYYLPLTKAEEVVKFLKN